MVLTAEGGTDGANIVLFWPENLPVDADAVLAKNPIELADRMSKEGKLIWFPCDGDGGFNLSVFVRTPIPEMLKSVCKQEEVIPSLIVKGDGHFGGLEGIFKNPKSDAALLGCTQKLEIPPGTYSATVYTTDYDGVSNLLNPWVQEKAGSFAYWMGNFYSGGCALSFIALIGTIGVLAFLPEYRNLWTLGPILVLLLAISLMGRTKAYKRAYQAERDFKKAYPNYVVSLE